MTKEEIIEAILVDELEMFLSVNSREPSACQENPAGFRFYRGAVFSTWSMDALESYRDDVQQAKSDGKNLVTLKYARMENLIAPLNENELIDKIVTTEIAWVKDVTERFPNVHSRMRPVENDSDENTSVRTYLRCELETYSDRTLEFYYQNQQNCQKEGINPAEQMCSKMVKGAGFTSLQEAEEVFGSVAQ